MAAGLVSFALGTDTAGSRASMPGAARMVTMQGGVFGCVATSEEVVAATTVDVTTMDVTMGDHHAG